YPIREIIIRFPSGAGLFGPGNSSTKNDCFVATAVYQDPHHPIVNEFRLFRDEFLARSKTGERVIGWYNRNGPKLAAVIKKMPSLRPAAKAILTPAAKGLSALRRVGLFAHNHNHKEPPAATGPK